MSIPASLKRKIVQAAIPVRVPGPHELADRLDTVLTVVYLAYNEAYLATGGPDPSRRDLAEDAIWLAGVVHDALPRERRRSVCSHCGVCTTRERPPASTRRATSSCSQTKIEPPGTTRASGRRSSRSSKRNVAERHLLTERLRD